MDLSLVKIQNSHPTESMKADILVVDDLPDNLYLLANILAERGYEVRQVMSGRQAITDALAAPPDLILLDIMMPEMTGFEVCEQLKAHRLTASIPIIFVSARGEAFDKVKAFELGGVDYITKPFQVEEVLVRVAHQLEIVRQQKQLQEQNSLLQQLVTLDGLTSLANRRKFDDYLRVEWQRMARSREPLSLIMSDVDFFKNYNDTYGHQAGDECLRQVAGAIRRCAKRPGDLVARYGGEEFTAILPQTPLPGAVQIAIAIQQAVKALEIPHPHSAASHWVTLSLGITSIIPTMEIDPEQLVTAADTALYQAKASGRNTYCIQALNL